MDTLGASARQLITDLDGVRVLLDVEQVITDTKIYQPQGMHILVTMRGAGDWLSGDRIRFPATIRKARLLGLPGEFDYPKYLESKGLAGIALVSDTRRVVLMRAGARFSLWRSIDRSALQVRKHIQGAVPDANRHSVLLALTTGEQRLLPQQLSTAYARAGVSHILSVSGFHVGVVVALWVLILRWILLRWEWLALRIDIRRASLLSSLPLMLGYLVFTGAAPATARSVLMLAAVVIALWTERDVDILDALLAAAFVLLLTDPLLVFDISFQLSFLALWGLIVLTPVLLQPFQRFAENRLIYPVVTLVAASLAAMLATMIPVLASFHQASLTGLFTNLLIVPLLGYIVTVMATAAVPMVFAAPWLAGWLYQLCGLLVDLSNRFVLAAVPLPVLQAYTFGAVDVVAVIIVLAIFSFVPSRRIKAGLITSITVLLVLHHYVSSVDSGHDNMLAISFLSVGQGDSTLVRLPDGKTMLIDGGGYLIDNGRDFGERYLVPALHAMKIKTIDIMVLTHPHPDHIGGLPSVAEQFKVKELWQPPGDWPFAAYQRLVAAVHHQGGVVRRVAQGDYPLHSQNLNIAVLAPVGTNASSLGDNNDSLVLQLQYGKQSFLFMGDAGFAVEEKLITKDKLKTTLLKVGHHGSNTASSERFLQQIRPELAVISVGHNNRFGLPNPDVLERLEQAGATVYRTDQCGTLQVTCDGTACKIAGAVAKNRRQLQMDVLF